MALCLIYLFDLFNKKKLKFFNKGLAKKYPYGRTFVKDLKMKKLVNFMFKKLLFKISMY
jgi:hypothetical protein